MSSRPAATSTRCCGLFAAPVQIAGTDDFLISSAVVTQPRLAFDEARVLVATLEEGSTEL